MTDESNWSEAKIQQTAITHLRNNYPETYGCLWHIPNGGNRDRRTASVLTGQGVVPGIADLNLLWKGKIYMIEVKALNGVVSPYQKVIHSKHKIHSIDTYIFTSSILIIHFVENVITNNNILDFSEFISPYSVADNYHKYLEELRVYKINQLKR